MPFIPWHFILPSWFSNFYFHAQCSVQETFLTISELFTFWFMKIIYNTHKKFVSKELVTAGECDCPECKTKKGTLPLTGLSNKFAISFSLNKRQLRLKYYMFTELKEQVRVLPNTSLVSGFLRLSVRKRGNCTRPLSLPLQCGCMSEYNINIHVYIFK